MADTDDNNIEKIKLICLSGTGSIWNTFDWRRILDHRICGRFIGNLPQQCHQVKENGFPFLLTKNETKLLLEKKTGVLLTPDHLLKQPSDDAKQKYEENRQTSFEKQTKLLKCQRRLEILEKADKIITGKLNKRQKLDNNEKTRELIIQEELSKIPDPAQEYLFVQISTQDYEKEEKWKPVIWNYPETDLEKLEYETYRKLHEMGYWVTPGTKFGGQFLAYPGSPHQYHAQFIIKCVNHIQNPLKMIAFARLAHSTRKTAVYAYVNKNVTFQSISWQSK